MSVTFLSICEKAEAGGGFIGQGEFDRRGEELAKVGGGEEELIRGFWQRVICRGSLIREVCPGGVRQGGVAGGGWEGVQNIKSDKSTTTKNKQKKIQT